MSTATPPNQFESAANSPPLNSCSKQHCILFYKYHPLTSSPATLEKYRIAQEELCRSLSLTGRILLGLSENGEGINGTLAGRCDDLMVYVNCMLGKDYDDNHGPEKSADKKEIMRKNAAINFRSVSKTFFTELGIPELMFDSENDFKWSTWSPSSASSQEMNASWFPDLNIKMVKEIISTGGAFSEITTKDTSVGYLTPKEWHAEMKLLMQKHQQGLESTEMCKGEDQVETILIDVRNHKECQIGTFLPGVAIDPNTKTFAQFPKWVRDHSGRETSQADVSATKAAMTSEVAATTAPAPASTSLDNKRILLYCTGGIRCEKASAYIRQMVPHNKGVYHLKGGIHKYLEEFGSKATNNGECLFVGKNFVFDRRGAMSGDDCLAGQEVEQSGETKSMVVGQCFYCNQPHDTFLPENICTVCREPVLVCTRCISYLCRKQRTLRGMDNSNMNENERNIRVEFHCEDHFQVKNCYYTSLYGFSLQELNGQIQQLQLHSKKFEGIGKKGKQRRRTLRKQIEKIEACIKTMDKGGNARLQDELKCRNCGSIACDANCWGFHGGHLRMINKEKSKSITASDCTSDEGAEIGIGPASKNPKQIVRTPSNHRPAKRLKREKELEEIEALQLCKAASEYRLANGLRVPPPKVRVLRSSVKGRWCGKTLRSVMSAEFREFADVKHSSNGDKHCGDWLDQINSANLLRINGIPVAKMTGNSSLNTILRNMDTLERIVHWHEPPVSVPEKITLTKHMLPDEVFAPRKNRLSTNEAKPNAENSPLLYSINKPPSVPVHPAGPYYANSLLLMVEAQENLRPMSLIPCHRIDRCTSGVLLCANNPDVARVIQGVMSENASSAGGESSAIKKLYLARVKGKFPHSSSEIFDSSTFDDIAGIVSTTWHGNTLEVSAPIAVKLSDYARCKGATNKADEEASTMMHRVVSPDGKHAISRFKFISHDPITNLSLVSCCPITGRGHQLRVHLQAIGFPIQNDVAYGGIVDDDKATEQETISIQSMLKVSMASCIHDKSVTTEEARAAVTMCRCCSDREEGVKSSFQTAQLLGGGHMIDLHAYKYSISIKHGQSSNNEEGATVMEFTATLPTWALTFDGLLPEDINWIK